MTNRNKSEKELVSAIVAGDEAAFKTVFDKFYKGLLRFAISYIEEVHTAENMVQDAFVLLWEKRAELDEEDPNLHAFLVKVVKLKAWNSIAKHRRRMSIEKKIHDDVIRELDLKMYTLDSVNTSSLYIEEIEEIVAERLKKLPEQTQKIFNYSRREYLSNKEIAERLNLSEKSVEYHITKTLKVLRTELADYLKVVLFLSGI